jgi:ribosome maturation factor RimP
MSVGMSRASLLAWGNETLHIDMKQTTLADAFARALDEIEHDPQFLGVELVQHACKRNRHAAVLSVTIDRPSGVDLATCERVANAINRRLDGCEERYSLEVESAGLNRPLLRPGDYDRFSGRSAKIVTSLLVHGGKTHRGVLRGVRGTNVVLQTAGGELLLPLAAIDRANLEYDVRTDLVRAKKERKHHA